MLRLKITREVNLPDPMRLARYKRAPELGPRLLFFSGGTALRELSRRLVAYTQNSVHVITPFDSGGSSAVLREAFHMPAVGDIRNRLMALADQSIMGNPDIYRLFAYRFPKDKSPEDLNDMLNSLVEGTGPLIEAVTDPMREIIRNHLMSFQENMPDDFDLRGASIGNLILAGGYLMYRRHFDSVIYLFSKLVEVRGVVRPVINQYLHLAAELEDSRVLVGQHLLTGKETPPIDSPVRRIWLTKDRENPEPTRPEIRDKTRRLISRADLICYPVGSFYTSVLCNLLPGGVGRAISRTECAKVYVPNTGGLDPEQRGMTLASSVRMLLHYLYQDCDGDPPSDRLLNFVLIDSRRGDYPAPLELKKIERLGVEIIDTELITEQSRPYLDPELLAQVLLSLT